LWILDLSDNKLTGRALIGLTNVRAGRLYLSDNRIRTLPPGFLARAQLAGHTGRVELDGNPLPPGTQLLFAPPRPPPRAEPVSRPRYESDGMDEETETPDRQCPVCVTRRGRADVRPWQCRLPHPESLCADCAAARLNGNTPDCPFCRALPTM
jgi:hypothetical protein